MFLAIVLKAPNGALAAMRAPRQGRNEDFGASLRHYDMSPNFVLFGVASPNVSVSGASERPSHDPVVLEAQWSESGYCTAAFAMADGEIEDFGASFRHYDMSPDFVLSDATRQHVPVLMVPDYSSAALARNRHIDSIVLGFPTDPSRFYLDHRHPTRMVLHAHASQSNLVQGIPA
ncbi:hypothetical protein [Paraburkholderia sp.]|uniref:hypothetical protein n=1 Tax=Paraburkholderia sp. TaxID=1926495 RepID=UPI0026277D50|nr:hypothetical protein [Paraburkholderia sp.]